MYYLLYNLSLYLFSLVFSPILLILLLIKKKYRKGLWQKLGFIDDKTLEEIHGSVWFHAVSVGEVLAAVPLISLFRKRYPEESIVVSTVTYTGNQILAKELKEVKRLYYPLDFGFIVKRVIRRVNPKILIFIETEIWPNFLRELKKRGIPSILVNGRISEGSYKGYRAFRPFFKRVLRNLDLICMQSDFYAQRMVAMGAEPEKIVVTGNLKFHRGSQEVSEEEQEEILRRLNLKPADQVFIAGSTHKGEEEIIVDAYKELKKERKGLKLILAPRHPDRAEEVESLLRRSRLSYKKMTEIMADSYAEVPFPPMPGYVPYSSNESSNPLSEETKDVILVDTIGDLSKLYRIGTVVYVGGSLVDKGGQNLIEPAIQKKSPIFGPYTSNFMDISLSLKEKGGGIEVKNKEDLIFQVKKLLSDSSLREKMGDRAFEIVRVSQGSLQKNMDQIERLLFH